MPATSRNATHDTADATPITGWHVKSLQRLLNALRDRHLPSAYSESIGTISTVLSSLFAEDDDTPIDNDWMATVTEFCDSSSRTALPSLRNDRTTSWVARVGISAGSVAEIYASIYSARDRRDGYMNCIQVSGGTSAYSPSRGDLRRTWFALTRKLLSR